MMAPSPDVLDYPLVVAILLKKLGGSVKFTTEDVLGCENIVIELRRDDKDFCSILEVHNRCSIQ